MEPVEEVTIDVDDEFNGKVIEKLCTCSAAHLLSSNSHACC